MKRCSTTGKILVGAGLAFVLVLFFAPMLFSFFPSSSPLHEFPNNVTFDVSSDGQRVVLSSNGNGGSDLYSYRVGSGQLTRICSTELRESHPALSPDGKLVAFTRTGSERDGGRIIIRRLGDGSESTVPAPGGSSDDHAAFTSDGSAVLLARARHYEPASGLRAASWGDWDILRFDVSTKALSPLTRSSFSLVESMRSSHQSRRVVFSAVPRRSSVPSRDADAWDPYILEYEGLRRLVRIPIAGMEASPVFVRSDGIQFLPIGSAGSLMRSWDGRKVGQVSLGTSTVFTRIQQLAYAAGAKKVVFSAWSTSAPPGDYGLWSMDEAGGGRVQRILRGEVLAISEHVK